jgi:hypothetical protein
LTTVSDAGSCLGIAIESIEALQLIVEQRKRGKTSAEHKFVAIVSSFLPAACEIALLGG